MCLRLGVMFGIIPIGEETAMDFGVEGFDSTLQHFRKAGVVGDIKDVKSSVPKVPGSAAGGEDFHTTLCKGVGYF